MLLSDLGRRDVARLVQRGVQDDDALHPSGLGDLRVHGLHVPELPWSFREAPRGFGSELAPLPSRGASRASGSRTGSGSMSSMGESAFPRFGGAVDFSARVAGADGTGATGGRGRSAGGWNRVAGG